MILRMWSDFNFCNIKCFLVLGLPVLLTVSSIWISLLCTQTGKFTELEFIVASDSPCSQTLLISLKIIVRIVSIAPEHLRTSSTVIQLTSKINSSPLISAQFKVVFAPYSVSILPNTLYSASLFMWCMGKKCFTSNSLTNNKA